MADPTAAIAALDRLRPDVATDSYKKIQSMLKFVEVSYIDPDMAQLDPTLAGKLDPQKEYLEVIQKMADTIEFFKNRQDANQIDDFLQAENNSVIKTMEFLDKKVVVPLTSAVAADGGLLPFASAVEGLDQLKDACSEGKEAMQAMCNEIEQAYRICVEKLHQYFLDVVQAVNNRYSELEAHATSLRDTKLGRVQKHINFLDNVMSVIDFVIDAKSGMPATTLSDPKLSAGVRILQEWSSMQAQEDAYFHMEFSVDADLEYIASIGFLEDPQGPVVKKVSPNHGPCIGGTPIEVQGSGLGQTASEVRVFVGDRECYGVEVLAAGILVRAVAPDGVGMKMPVTVAVMPLGSSVERTSSKVASLGSSETCWKYDNPTIFKMTGSKGPTIGGTRIRVEGENLGTAKDKLRLTVGGRDCVDLVVLKDYCALEATTPEGFGSSHAVVVHVNGQKSDAKKEKTFFSYDPPFVDGIDPTEGATDGTTRMTIDGNNFGPETELIEVTIGGEPAPDVRLDIPHKRISCNVPFLAATHIIEGMPVVVSIAGQDSKQVVKYDAVDMDRVRECIKELDARGQHNSEKGFVDWDKVHERLEKKMKAIEKWEEYHKKPFLNPVSSYVPPSAAGVKDKKKVAKKLW